MAARTPVPAIDIHTHIFPERLQAAVRRALGAMYGWSFDLPSEPAPFAAMLAERNVERFCSLPYAHKPGMARALNEWMAAAAAEHPSLIPFACVNQDDADPVAILEEAFDAGCVGVKLHHQVQNVAPDDERLFPVYELMLDRDRPLLVHAGKGPTDNGLVGAAPFRRMMERYPSLRICVAHLGAPEQTAFASMLGDFPQLHLDTSGLGGAGLAGLDVGGVADRILFGSDAPNIAFDYDVSVTRILDAGLGEDGERAIFRDNAVAFLRLDEAGG